MEPDVVLDNSSVIKQKGKSENGCFKKTKHAKFSEKNISYPLIRTRTSFDMLCFLETPVLRFALLLHYRRISQTCYLGITSAAFPEFCKNVNKKAI